MNAGVWADGLRLVDVIVSQRKSPAYAATHRRHSGASASSAAGSNHRAARPKKSVRRDSMKRLFVAIVIADPAHGRFRIFIAALGHEIEQGVGGDQLIEAASVG